MSVEGNKRLVARAVAEVINDGDLGAVDELYAPEIAAAARNWVGPFRTAFPDVRMDTLSLVGGGDTVVGHFRCSGTQTGPWMGRPGTDRAFRDVREVYWFLVAIPEPLRPRGEPRHPEQGVRQRAHRGQDRGAPAPPLEPLPGPDPVGRLRGRPVRRAQSRQGGGGEEQAPVA